MNFRTTVRLAALLACATLLHAVPAAAAAKPAAAGAKSATREDAPFWTGTPNSAAFTKNLEARLARARKAVDQLVAVKGTRTLENTLRVYDEINIQLEAAAAPASLIEHTHPDSNLRHAAEGMTRKASALATDISLDRRVYDALTALDLGRADAETRFYVQRELRDFKLAGVDKDPGTRAKIKALRDSLVKVGQEFDKNIRTDQRSIQVASAAELDGLPADFIANRKPGPDGKITLTVNYPDYVPVMTYAKNDEVRRRLYMEFQNRAHPRNNEVLTRLVALRHELAGLLGYSNWADYITANKMVGSGRNAREFIDKIVGVSGASADAEYQVLLRRKKQDVPDATVVNFWESGYWSEMVRKSDYDFDSQSVRPYFPYQRVKQGMLDLSARLFGVTFKQLKDAPVWHPQVECWEMFENGRLIGRFYLDMHPRENKYNHAAQFDIRTGVAGRQIPEAALVCNLPGGDPGDPGLCEYNDVETFLHEFGHLLHTLFSGHNRWAGISGIKTEHDFVEAPSQMLEEWLRDPATLATFARHHETGEPIPAAVVKQMNRANDFGKALGVRRQMVYADLSLSVYDRPPSQVNPDAMMAELVKKYQPFPFVEDTHFQCSFGHLDGYSAVYYTYMWSLVIAKDLFSQFDHNDLLSTTIAKRYRDAVLAPGGSKPAAELVKDFLGRPFDFDAYQAWLNEAN